MSLAAAKDYFVGYWEPYIAFRAARVMFLLLIIIMPWEAVTSLREICMVCGLLFLAAYHVWAGDTDIRPTPLFWPLVFYVACAAFSLLSAVDFDYSLRELRAELLKGLIVFYTAAHYVKHRDHLEEAWRSLLIGAALMTLLGVFLFFTEGGSLMSHAKRAGSLHSGYGGLASYISLIWPFVLLAPLAWPESRLKPLLWALAPLTVFMAYITYSRACWGALVVESALLFMIFSKRRRLMAILALVMVLVMGAALFTLPGSRHGEKWARLMEKPEEVGGTTGDLIAVWQHAYRYLSENPFKGIGLGRHSFSKAFPEFRETHQPLLWHAHNMFVEIALELGLQGLAAVLIIMIVLFCGALAQGSAQTGRGTGFIPGRGLCHGGRVQPAQHDG